jgi:hypothetical protein
MTVIVCSELGVHFRAKAVSDRFATLRTAAGPVAASCRKRARASAGRRDTVH